MNTIWVSAETIIIYFFVLGNSSFHFDCVRVFHCLRLSEVKSQRQCDDCQIFSKFSFRFALRVCSLLFYFLFLFCHLFSLIWCWHKLSLHTHMNIYKRLVWKINLLISYFFGYFLFYLYENSVKIPGKNSACYFLMWKVMFPCCSVITLMSTTKYKPGQIVLCSYELTK